MFILEDFALEQLGKLQNLLRGDLLGVSRFVPYLT